MCRPSSLIVTKIRNVVHPLCKAQTKQILSIYSKFFDFQTEAIASQLQRKSAANWNQQRNLCGCREMLSPPCFSSGLAASTRSTVSQLAQIHDQKNLGRNPPSTRRYPIHRRPHQRRVRPRQIRARVRHQREGRLTVAKVHSQTRRRLLLLPFLATHEMSVPPSSSRPGKSHAVSGLRSTIAAPSRAPAGIVRADPPARSVCAELDSRRRTAAAPRRAAPLLRAARGRDHPHSRRALPAHEIRIFFGCDTTKDDFFLAQQNKISQKKKS